MQIVRLYLKSSTLKLTRTFAETKVDHNPRCSRLDGESALAERPGLQVSLLVQENSRRLEDIRERRFYICGVLLRNIPWVNWSHNTWSYLCMCPWSCIRVQGSLPLSTAPSTIIQQLCCVFFLEVLLQSMESKMYLPLCVRRTSGASRKRLRGSISSMSRVYVHGVLVVLTMAGHLAKAFLPAPSMPSRYVASRTRESTSATMAYDVRYSPNSWKDEGDIEPGFGGIWPGDPNAKKYNVRTWGCFPSGEYEPDYVQYQY